MTKETQIEGENEDEPEKPRSGEKIIPQKHQVFSTGLDSEKDFMKSQDFRYDKTFLSLNNSCKHGNEAASNNSFMLATHNKTKINKTL